MINVATVYLVVVHQCCPMIPVYYLGILGSTSNLQNNNMYCIISHGRHEHC